VQYQTVSVGGPQWVWSLCVAELVHSEVEFDHVDSGLAEESQVPTLDVVGHHRPHSGWIEVPGGTPSNAAAAARRSLIALIRTGLVGPRFDAAENSGL
jgi:hypothetical protein